MDRSVQEVLDLLEEENRKMGDIETILIDIRENIAQLQRLYVEEKVRQLFFSFRGEKN